MTTADRKAFTETTPLLEAASGTPKSRRFRARLIAGDIQGSSGYYSAEILRRDGPGVFVEGLPVYIDHPSATDAMDRPERSIRDLAGRLATPATYTDDGLYAVVEVYPHVAPVIEAMAGDIGMSIRAFGTAEASTHDSIRGPMVTSLTEAMSVDFVTAAGAGGEIVSLLESARAALEEAISDKPWSDFTQADYTIEQWRKACLISPAKASDSKDDYSLPVREPAGALNRNGVHAAASRLGSVKATPEQKKAAAKTLIGLYGQLKEDPPKSLTKAAGMQQKESAAGRPANLVEGRNVGGWLESRIHAGFTELADDMYGNGRLSRDERLVLSTAIGAGLDAFTASVTQAAPQLYERDLWDGPPDDSAGMTEARRTLSEGHGMTANDLSAALSQAVKDTYGGEGRFVWVRDNTDEWVVFSVEDPTDCDLYQQTYTVDDTTQTVTLTGDAIEVSQRTTYIPTGPDPTGLPADGNGLNENAPVSPADPTLKETEGTEMPELTEAQARELQEARDQAVADAEKANAERDAANTTLAEARRETAELRATETARPIATKLIGEAALPSVAAARALNEALKTVPLTDENTLDEAKLTTAVAEAIKAEQSYVAGLLESGGAGTVRGLGASSAGADGELSEADLEKGLEDMYTSIGLPSEQAALAAKGR